MLRKSMFRKPNIALEGQETPVSPAIPEDILVSCPVCREGIFAAELREHLFVCPKCGHHFRMKTRDRIAMLCDSGSFVELDTEIQAADPLHFPQYEQKLKKAQLHSGEKEAVTTGYAAIGGNPCAVFVMNPDFMMGSMSAAVGEKITNLFEYATRHRLPVVGYTVSGGARVQEGILSLMQMAKTSGAVGQHSEAGLFYLAVLTDPTTGGVTASFAMEGDIIFAEPGALIGFAGPRVIEQTMRQKLPAGFQRAEFLLQKGFLDRIVARSEQKEIISMLLSLHAPHPARQEEKI